MDAIGIPHAVASKAKALFDYLYLRHLLGDLSHYNLAEDLRLNLDEFTSEERVEFAGYVMSTTNINMGGAKSTRSCRTWRAAYGALDPNFTGNIEQQGLLLAVETKRIVLNAILRAYVLDILYNQLAYRLSNFFGGTCLDVMYGLNSLSEDLNFDNSSRSDSNKLCGFDSKFSHKLCLYADIGERLTRRR